jgi:uncharacterized protein YcbK (DUF882 family)
VRRALALLVVAQAAHAAPAKKDRELATHGAAHGAPPAAGTRAVTLVNLYNEHTRDWLAIDPAAPPSADEIDDFFRDHYTNKTTRMDRRIVGFVLAAAARFHSDMIDIVSGFRHPKYNLILRKKGHQVARDSQHTHGNAVDFSVPHVTTAELHAWAKAQKAGGVGLYVTSGFVHMDTGPIRYWSGD